MGAEKLSALKVRTAGPGEYSDGRGLYLRVTPGLARSWVFQFSWRGRRPEMGLGPFPDVSLAEARDARDAARKLIRDGVNPIEARRAERKADAGRKTFGEIADELLKAKSSEWRSARHAAQWKASLVQDSAPLRSKPVDEISTAAVLEVLKPLWLSKPVTAARTRGRIEAVLDAAKAQGLRSGENPAAWRANLAHLLPRAPKLAKEHHAAMSYADVPALIGRLRESESIQALAFEFLIITAARLGNVLGAEWDEIDFEAGLWTVPAPKMKSGVAHRVPLVPRAVEILKKMREHSVNQLVFPGRCGAVMASSTLGRVLAQSGGAGVTVHGFRSSFRDWCENETHTPREIAEMCLAHSVGSAVERAYRRSEALEKRRALMQAWASYCEPKRASGADVVAFKRPGA